MFESQSSTPEGFQGNPESGIDQFLNNQPAKPSYEELEAELAKVRADSTIYINQRDSYIDLWNKARNFIQSSIDSDDWEDSELEEPFWSKLADLMDLEISRTVQVEITVTYTGSIKLPRGIDADDLNGYNFSTSVECDDYEADLEEWEVSVREV